VVLALHQDDREEEPWGQHLLFLWLTKFPQFSTEKLPF
jgi:hypothetical protein